VKDGRTEVVRKYITHHVDVVGYKDVNSLFLLHWAARRSHIEVAKLLLSRKAKTDNRDSNGETALFYAVQNGDEDMAALFIGDGTSLDLLNDSGNSCLHLAVKGDNINIVRSLCNTGADIYIRDSERNTPFHHAARLGNNDLVQFFIDQGIDIDVKNSNGDSAIHRCAAAGFTATIALILDQGGNVQCKNNFGDTPLHACAYSGEKGMLEFLLERGANINAKNDWGETPLHNAAVAGRYIAVKLLLQHGASTDIKNRRGFTAYDKVKNRDTFREVTALLSKDHSPFDIHSKNVALLFASHSCVEVISKKEAMMMASIQNQLAAKPSLKRLGELRRLNRSNNNSRGMNSTLDSSKPPLHSPSTSSINRTLDDNSSLSLNQSLASQRSSRRLSGNHSLSRSGTLTGDQWSGLATMVGASGSLRRSGTHRRISLPGPLRRQARSKHLEFKDDVSEAGEDGEDVKKEALPMDFLHRGLPSNVALLVLECLGDYYDASPAEVETSWNLIKSFEATVTDMESKRALAKKLNQENLDDDDDDGGSKRYDPEYIKKKLQERRRKQRNTKRDLFDESEGPQIGRTKKSGCSIQ
jgi:ankyrin repeat protein